VQGPFLQVPELLCRSLQPDGLAGLGMAFADRTGSMAGGQSSWVREAAQLTPGPPSQARLPLDAQRTLASWRWYDATREDRPSSPWFYVVDSSPLV
jgi:hypothetical protein